MVTVYYKSFLVCSSFVGFPACINHALVLNPMYMLESVSRMKVTDMTPTAEKLGRDNIFDMSVTDKNVCCLGGGSVTANIGWYVVLILHDWPSCNIDITWPVELRLWVDRLYSFNRGFPFRIVVFHLVSI